ncbi:AraC family transcriptional regulator [Fibrella sp. HMF5335]|uniref:AraC family transcriptional regulator n=1 Tax=Fibrella rubiginis TaxID=2817060 RepID=A0A939K214_9BACT|nr:AraC family transcriptional regulator [Fibrella rubiginis]MBO0937732.1 AraC family transcriptional regulator [Fibrella rubiginis]
MPGKFALEPINLSDTRALTSLVENRRVFTLNQCELTIFETYKQCSGLVLSYDGMFITSMLRGRKVMYLSQNPGFSFLPGETVILPEGVSMKVDFPEADARHPVQCATIALDWQVVGQTLAFLNERYPRKGDSGEWKLNFNQYHFYNNRELANVLNRLISISMEDNMDKDALADLTLKSLLIRVIQTQNMAVMADGLPTNNRFAAVISYIHEHLTEKIGIDLLCQKACMSKSSFFRSFKGAFGLSPVEFIIRERISLARRLLANPTLTVAEVSDMVGFQNPHYFSRLFKLLEGTTPKTYRQQTAESL